MTFLEPGCECDVQHSKVTVDMVRLFVQFFWILSKNGSNHSEALTLLDKERKRKGLQYKFEVGHLPRDSDSQKSGSMKRVLCLVIY
jgi:uncharacterized protein YfiM (DUF2279 family)